MKRKITLSEIKALFVFILLSCACAGQIPILNSYPAITNKVVYLDFDGQKVTGTSWNSGATINALPSTKTAADILLIWKRVSEDYRPFDVNITTDSVRFNNAPPNKRMRVVITPTSAWYGSAGGVAYVGSFTWGGTPGTPCWIFEDQLGYSTKNIAEACSHEVGHTLTLRHQSTYDASCNKTAEYNPGTGTGVTSWAPIMGVGYNRNVTTWYNGKSATSCTLTQNDHNNSGIGITSSGFLSFLPDDVGDIPANAKVLNLNALNLVDSGLISQPSDLDAYQFSICNTRYVTINVKPWALDTMNYSGANLDVHFFLYNAANNQLAVDTPLTKLYSRVGMNLNPGTYWFTIDGGRSSNYSDYGSLGRYYLSIKATNPPALMNSIVTSTNICAGQNTTLSYTSNGTPTQWQWTVTGPTTNTFTVQNPNLAFSAGIHTISLLATSGASLSCPTTLTLNINPLPPLLLTNTVTALCPGKSTTLGVSGAASYTWMPGSFSGTSQIVTPTVTTTYTIYGSNGTCNNSTVTTINLSPDFTLQASITATRLCIGESLTITANGASTYTINPGAINSNSAVLIPGSTIGYVVSGKSNGCTKTAVFNVQVTPHYQIFVNALDTALCEGDSTILNATGATSYTFNPGGISGNIVTVSPAATTIYTITGSDPANACIEDTVVTISVKACNLASIREEKANEAIRIYPNPSCGNLVIETSANDKKIEVINSIGQTVLIQKMTGKPLLVATEAWSRGVYFIRLSSGSDVYTEKIIIE